MPICKFQTRASLEHVRIFYFKLYVCFCLLPPPSKIRTNLRNISLKYDFFYIILYPDVLLLKQAEIHGSWLVSKSRTVWFDCLFTRQGQEGFWLTKLWCQAKLSLHNWKMLLDTSKVTFSTPLKVPTKVSRTNWGQHDPTIGKFLCSEIIQEVVTV